MARTMSIATEFLAIDKFSSVVSKMTAGVSNFNSKTGAAIERFNRKANAVAGNMAVTGGAVLGAMGVAANSAIKFQDKMADVAKTTNLNEKETEAYSQAILKMSKNTRTSIEDLQDIGVVGGTIGVAKNELIAFTKAGNDFAIALGRDFGSTEEAVTQVAKLKNLFKETRNVDIATSMTKAGSAINEVSNMAGSAQNINDFMLRLGALPDVMKPSITQAAALGGVLEDAGLSSEIAAGGFSNLMLVAGKNIGAFAKQMGLSVSSANKLYQTDPGKFAVEFSKSLNKLSSTKLAVVLNDLKVGTQESIKVVGALGSQYGKLEKAQTIASDAFVAGNSISKEAAKKNETWAGKIAMAKNNMEALSITVGTKVAPILSNLIDVFIPLIEKVGSFAEKHPKLIRFVAKLGLGLVVLAGVLKGITTVLAIGNIAMAAYSAAMTWFSGVALTAALSGTSLAAVIWSITWPILAVIAAIAAVIAIFYYWDEIVAWFSKQFKKFGDWISGIWQGIVSYFKNFSFEKFFMDIGQAMINFLLFPLKSVLKLAAMLPGSLGNAAKGGLAELNKIGDLSVMIGKDVKKQESPEVITNSAINKSTLKGGIDIRVKDKGGNVESVKNNVSGIPVKVTSTQGVN